MKIGILGAGKIAGVMADTIQKLNAAGRQEAELYAVAARELPRAQAFAVRHGVQNAFGSYEEMLRDPALELVYVATPHSHHYKHIKLCADYGKHILCEKAFTVSARQAQDAISHARNKGVLVTEAIWTRYQPMRRIIDDTLKSGLIGEPKVLTANLGFPMTHKQRIVEPELAGGALLDVGVYTLNFAEMLFGHADAMHGLCTKNEKGVDMTDSITLYWKDGRIANLTAAANSASDKQGIVYGTNGYLVVENINNPQSLKVYDEKGKLLHSVNCPPQMTGYEYEVLETVESIQKGMPECPSMPHRETVRMMEMMDGLRSQMGVHYPCEEPDTAF